GERRPPLGERMQRLGRIRRRACRIAFVLKDARHQVPDVLFVVDDENVQSHLISDYFAACSSTTLPAGTPIRASNSASNWKRTSVPPPGASSKPTWPKCSSTIFLTMASPSPVPLARVVI